MAQPHNEASPNMSESEINLVPVWEKGATSAASNKEQCFPKYARKKAPAKGGNSKLVSPQTTRQQVTQPSIICTLASCAPYDRKRQQWKEITGYKMETLKQLVARKVTFFRLLKTYKVKVVQLLLN